MVQVEDLNNYLKMFPGYQQGMEELQNGKLLDIYKFRIPVLWQKQFLLQNWDLQHHSRQEFWESCKWLKTAKDIKSRTFLKQQEMAQEAGLAL
jgi:hypothetical protein